MAKVLKRLSIPVGSYTKDGTTKVTVEYREIGVLMEFEGRDGNTWQEIKLNLDILNPSLLLLARGQVEKNSSTARVKLFDLPARQKPDAPGGSGLPDEEEDGIPY